jgi:hypothetical protein
MKVLLAFLLLLAAFPLLSDAQTVAVKKDNARVEGKNIPGYQVSLAASTGDVQTSLARYLKMIGKTKQGNDIITVNEPLIGGKKYTQPLLSTVKGTGSTAEAWIGVDSESGEDASLSRHLEKIIYDFGVSFYREKIQVQIDESLRALQTVEKQQLRLANQNKDLHSKIESNKQEKVQLEKSLVNNKIESEDLSRKLSENLKAQDSVAVATEQIRKVVQMHKEKQQKVH